MATTFKVCRDLAHAVELYEAGLLTVDLDTSFNRSSPHYVFGAEKFESVEHLTTYYPHIGGWLPKDFGYLEED